MQLAQMLPQLYYCEYKSPACEVFLVFSDKTSVKRIQPIKSQFSLIIISNNMKFILFVFSIIALLLCATAQTVDKSACALPRDIGPCRKADPKFFFNSESKACEDFLYGGCKGNENRFDSKEECEKTCL